jgi:hypothetical protein
MPNLEEANLGTADGTNLTQQLSEISPPDNRKEQAGQHVDVGQCLTSGKHLEYHVVFLRRTATQSFSLDGGICDSLGNLLNQLVIRVSILDPTMLVATTILDRRLSPRLLCLCQESATGKSFGSRRYVTIGPTIAPRIRHGASGM